MGKIKSIFANNNITYKAIVLWFCHFWREIIMPVFDFRFFPVDLGINTKRMVQFLCKTHREKSAYERKLYCV